MTSTKIPCVVIAALALKTQSFSPETTIYNCQGNVKENSLKALKGLAQLNSPGSILQEIIRTTHSCDMAYNFQRSRKIKEKRKTCNNEEDLGQIIMRINMKLN